MFLTNPNAIRIFWQDYVSQNWELISNWKCPHLMTHIFFFFFKYMLYVQQKMFYLSINGNNRLRQNVIMMQRILIASLTLKGLGQLAVWHAYNRPNSYKLWFLHFWMKRCCMNSKCHSRKWSKEDKIWHFSQLWLKKYVWPHLTGAVFCPFVNWHRDPTDLCWHMRASFYTFQMTQKPWIVSSIIKTTKFSQIIHSFILRQQKANWPDCN